MKNQVRWSTLIALCGRPVVVTDQHKGMKLAQGQLVTVFHGEGNERDWAEVGAGHCNVVERLIFPVAVPPKYHESTIVGINYGDFIVRQDPGNYFVDVEHLTLDMLNEYARLFGLSDKTPVLVGGAHTRCLSMQEGRLVHLLPQWTQPRSVVHAVFASRRGLSPAVRSFLDFLGETVPGHSAAVCERGDTVTAGAALPR